MQKCKKIIRGAAYYLNCLFALIISPIYIILGFVCSFLDNFAGISIVMAYLPFTFGECCRYIFYKIFLKCVGTKTKFKFGSFIQYRETEIGNNCLIGHFNSIGLIKMGNDVMCGGYVDFTSGLKQHSFTNPNIKMNKSPGQRIKINIGSDIWIGNNSLIGADIGDRCVIGMGSVVVKKIDGYGIYVGNPARKISDLKKEDNG